MTYEEWRDGLQYTRESGIIKNIELPSEIDSIKGISEELKQEISDSIDRLNSEYDIHLDSLSVESLGRGFEKVPFQYSPINDKGLLKSRIIINSDYDFNGSLKAFSERIMRNYNSGVLAAQKVEDLIAHEMAHVMTFQHIESYTMFILEERMLRNKFIPGISGYSDVSMDGSECIAEGFVRLRNKETIPKEAVALVKEYTERWRK